MAKNNEQFTLGYKSEIPDWMNVEANKGRVKYTRDEEGRIVGGTIFTSTKSIVFGIGDTIVLTKSGLGVIPKKGKTYGKKEKDWEM